MPTELGTTTIPSKAATSPGGDLELPASHLTSCNDVAATATDGTATSESRRSSGVAEVDDEGSWHAKASVVATHARTTPSCGRP
jgi:hypothetical protein